MSLLLAEPAWAAVALPERTPLTIERLQERLKTPMQSDGVRTLNLQRLVIDLRPENAAFRDQFYRLIQTQLQRSSTPLGIDFSYSLIRGELKISDLGLPTPLYGQAALPIFNEAEQSQLARDRRRLLQLSQLSRSLLVQTQVAPLQLTVVRGPLTLVQTRFEGFVDFSNTFFLGRVEAQGAVFAQETDWSETRFSQLANFANAVFQREVRFRSALFFGRARFNQALFQDVVSFQNSEFQAASFNQAVFQQTANFSRIRWQDTADLSQTRWQGNVLFDRSKFSQALFLSEAIFEQPVSFRQSQFNQSVNLRGAAVLSQMDLADASFAERAYLNVPNLQFDPRQARLLGDPGRIGRVLSVPTLQGNETLLRNLVQNFRQLQQIADANDVQYTTEKLRLRQIRQRLLGTDLNTASSQQLERIGFSAQQAATILKARAQQPLRNASDVLRLEGVDLATYVRVRDQITVQRPLSPGGWLLEGSRWIGLALLLLLTRFGTSFWLIFGVGLVAVAQFGVMFWLLDRLRRLRPVPLVPTLGETFWVAGGFSVLTLVGLAALFQTGESPWQTLAWLEALVLPLPLLLLSLIYGRGRYHDLMDTSYFVEDGSMRQVRLLIGRLPTIPLNPIFRDRYTPILWDRRWGWLNYFDFSLNNLLRFGFNDIRLRDQQMPGLITALTWYQWSLGVLYFALLLWTLSRTIPGLNLLIYFK
ncbi:MAG: pentapeptide repeat-containing protein [Synechococcales cyanobacterium M58_A2018_015]|nr:pentapeptide repeat-containing protein [Synechococcales cyanobacterium M58_A2018_015]